MIQYIIAGGIGAFLGFKSKKSKKSYAHGGVPYSKRFFDIVEYSKDGTIVRKIENKNTYEAEDIAFKLNNTNPVRSGYNYVKMEEIFAKGGAVRTNSKAVREKVRKHILESVYDTNEEEFDNISDASEYITSEFKRVADYPSNKHNIPNHQDRFEDYLRGIPFNFEYENWKIEEFLNGLGINPQAKEYGSDEMWRLYSYLIWKEVNDKYQYAKGGKTRKKRK